MVLDLTEKTKTIIFDSGKAVLIHKNSEGNYAVNHISYLTLGEWKEIMDEIKLLEQIPSDM